jgi:hypothetical protein
MKQIQQKLLQHKATISEADKGKILVIFKKDLNEKVNSFIKDNNITELNPTPKFQGTVQNTLKQCKNQ